MKAHTAPEPADLVNIQHLADRLAVHVSTLRRIWRAGLLPGYRIGPKTIRFRLRDVLDTFNGKEGLDTVKA